MNKAQLEALAGIVGATYGHNNPDKLLRAIMNLCAASNPNFKPEKFFRAVYLAADHFGQAWLVPQSEQELLAACERGEDEPIGEFADTLLERASR